MKKTKICKDCKKRKKVSQFYGVQGECKECTKKKVKERYNDPLFKEKIIAYERKRFNDPHRKEMIKLYAKKRKENHPNKLKANRLVNNLIRDGKINRLPCEVCGDLKSQAHHPDYRRPLFVKWLCFKHHRELHKKLYGRKNNLA